LCGSDYAATVAKVLKPVVTFAAAFFALARKANPHVLLAVMLVCVD